MSNSFTGMQLDDHVVPHSKATSLMFYFFFLKLFNTLKAYKTMKKNIAKMMALVFPSKT